MLRLLQSSLVCRYLVPCRCAFERGNDDTRCQFYKNAYESLCPPDWVSLARLLEGDAAAVQGYHSGMHVIVSIINPNLLMPGVGRPL